jgi:hypothetical protein
VNGRSRIDLSSSDAVFVKGKEADNHQRGLDATAQYLSPEDRRLSHSSHDVLTDLCRSKSERAVSCNTGSNDDYVEVILEAETAYTFKLTRVGRQCDFKFVSTLYDTSGFQVANSENQNNSEQGTCGGATVSNPVIVYTVPAGEGGGQENTSNSS